MFCVTLKQQKKLKVHIISKYSIQVSIYFLSTIMKISTRRVLKNAVVPVILNLSINLQKKKHKKVFSIIVLTHLTVVPILVEHVFLI